MHLFAVLSRFDAVDARLPTGVAEAILWAQIPMIFVASYFENKIDYGETLDSLPLWMKIKSVPVKISFTFAFTYLAIVALQTLDLELGPIDPSPPPEWDLMTRARFFLIMSVGMFFPNYLAATGLLVPNMRRVSGFIQKRTSMLVGLAITMVLGIVVGFGLTYAVNQKVVGDVVATATTNPFEDNFIVVFLMTLGGIFVPGAIGSLIDRMRGAEPSDE